MLEVAEGIQYLHSEGIVHGDLHGVSLVLSYNFNQLIRLSAREMSSWIVLSAAKLPILDRLDLLKLVFLDPLR